MDNTGFIQKQKYHKVVVLRDFRNVWSKWADANLHMTFDICIYAVKYFASPLLITPGKRLNRDVIQVCDIEGARVITAPATLC